MKIDDEREKKRQLAPNWRVVGQTLLIIERILRLFKQSLNYLTCDVHLLACTTHQVFFLIIFNIY